MKYKMLLLLCLAAVCSFAQLSQRTLDEPLPTQLIHLDLHTSEFFPVRRRLLNILCQFQA